MRISATIVVGALIVSGCASTDPNLKTAHATINDVSVRSSEESGYRVISVDGKSVERIQSPGLATIIPFAIVKPGVHTLGLEPDRLNTESGQDRKATTVTATFEQDKRYRIQLDQETVTVVEDRD